MTQNIASSYILDQIFRDDHLTNREVNQLFSIVFDENNPTDQVDFQEYNNVVNYLKNSQVNEIYNDLSGVSFEDENESYYTDPAIQCHSDHPLVGKIVCPELRPEPQNREKLKLLTKSFPGSLEHFRNKLALNQFTPLELESLPTVSLDFIYKDPDYEDVYHIGGIVNNPDGTQHNIEFTYYTAASYGEQDFTADPVKESLFGDIHKLLYDLHKANELTVEETSDFVDFANATREYGSANYNTNYSTHNQVEYFNTFWQPNEEDLLPFKLAVNTYSDRSIHFSGVLDIYKNVESILGHEILSLLDENGYSLAFIDFDHHANNRQLEVKKPSFDNSTDNAGYITQEHRYIYINTNSNKQNTIITVIHEIGHIINKIIQQNNEYCFKIVPNEQSEHDDVTLSCSILGEQREEFIYRLASEDPYIHQPTEYSLENEKEWFADFFTLFMLEKSSRHDLLKLKFDRNPSTDKSIYLTDNLMYLIMSKMVQVINDRSQNPESFSHLLEYGFDGLTSSAIKFDQHHGYKFPFNRIEDELHRHDVPQSHTLKKLDRAWEAVSYKNTLENSDIEFFDIYGELAIDHFNNREDPFIQRMYLNPQSNEEDMSAFTYYSDFYAIEIACRMAQAQSRREKVIILMHYGLTNSEELDAFLDGLTALDTAEVHDVINPNGLILETQEEHAQRLLRHDR